MSDKKTVDCPVHKTEMPVSLCIARQKILAEAPEDGSKGEAYRIYRKSCGRCKIGLELYRLEKLKAEMSIPGKIVPVQPDEFKTCSCGEKFHRHPDKGNASWSKAKYCPECAELTQYQRTKKFAQEPDVESVKLKEDAVLNKKPMDEVIDTTYFKICKRDGCSNKMFRDDTPAGAWQLKKYCCTACKKMAERAREKARKKLKRKRVAVASDFDPENAEKIARNITENELKKLAPFVDDVKLFDQLRSIAMTVGVDSQKAAHDAVWG